MPSIKRQEDVAAAEEAAKQQDRLKKAAEERHRFEKRVLALCTGSLVLVTVIWAVALSTDHWYDLAPPPEGVFLSGPRTVLRGGHSGLWKICTEQFHPANVTAYESLTTTVAPVSTTRRPRAQPCKRMGLRGRKRKRCRLFITNRFRFGLSQRRRPSQSQLLPTVTTPRTPDYPDSPDTNLTEWLVADFDDQVSNAADVVADNTDEEVALEPVDLEKEKILQMVEEEILERISDGAEDDLTVNETLFEALDEAIDEITSPTFRECRLKELSGGALQDSDLAGWQMLSYMRTLLTFSVVSVLLLVLGFLSALYTFKEPRYTFKRLSAGIQFIAFCGLLVVIQVYRSAAQYEQDDDMGGADMEVGFSQVLAWLALALQLLSSFLFLLYSRKKKRNKAASEELAMADEPTIIGR